MIFDASKIYLSMQLINCRTSALLDLYVGRSYEILHTINADKNLFELFVDLQFIIRPLRIIGMNLVLKI